MSSQTWKVVVAASAVLFLACSSKSDLPTSARANTTTNTTASTEKSSAETFQAAQKVIRNAQLRIEVNDVQKAAQSADSLIKQHGGFIADRRLNQSAQERRQANLVIRVPSDRIDEAMAALRQLGEVREESITAEDVSKVYADLETRVAVKQQTVERIRFLIDNRTAKLAEVLEVERELARAVGELEQMKGERRYYDQQVALSSITVALVDRAASRSSQLTGSATDAFQSSLDVLQRSVSWVVYVITFLAPWLGIALPLWWVFTRLRARPRLNS